MGFVDVSKQKHMVGHQYIWLRLNLIMGAIIVQAVKIEMAAIVREETGIPIVAASNNVTRDVGQIHPWLAWHYRLLSIGFSCC